MMMMMMMMMIMMIGRRRRRRRSDTDGWSLPSLTYLPMLTLLQVTMALDIFFQNFKILSYHCSYWYLSNIILLSGVQHSG